MVAVDDIEAARKFNVIVKGATLEFTYANQLHMLVLDIAGHAFGVYEVEIRI